MGNRKISELDQILNLDEEAEFPLSQDNGGTPTTFKAKLTQIATKIAEAITFSNLITNNKHIIGAINEAAQSGGGTTDYDDLENKPQINSVELSGNKSLDDLGIQPSEISKTASGSVVTFTDGGDDIPVKSFECEIVAQQASGTPTPVNPLPITGFSQADITVTDNDQVTNLYTIEFGQTIYGGRLIYANGQWAIEATHEILTLYGTERISLTGTGTGRRFRFDDTFTYNAMPLSSHFIESTGNSNPWGYYRLVSGYLLLTDNNSQMADETALKTWLANQYSGGTPVQLLCELATPVIIPITSSTRVKTISGANNIFSNTGEVSLEYFTENADEIAELVEAEIASKSADYHVYSTDEQIVGKWIDNSDIYEKTYHLTGLSYPNNAWTNNILGTSNINIVDWDGYFVIDPNNTRYPIKAFFRSNTVYASTNIDVALNDLNFFNNMGFTVVEVLVILRYIKTSSNTRSLNLSKGIEETEETAEIKTEEIKEAENEDTER